MPTLASRFRRPRLLIVGCGDIGLRVVKLLGPRWHVFALTTRAEGAALIRAAGAMPILGNLDVPATLSRLAGLADAVLHLAPPPSEGASDPRTARLLQALARRGGVQRIVYSSTTGVYGDCGGKLFDETRGIAPRTDRARRRADAEARLRRHALAHGTKITVLRIPGIYARDREGGARQRLIRGTPVLAAGDDVYTNHIHADDLARACVAALNRGRPRRVVHACDDTDMKMGDYFDLVADMEGLPRPPRLSLAEAQRQLPATLLSFMGESRRLANDRLKRELRLVLRYPTVREGLRA
jgi:nucleoside-diphosphate-sugar epimerase